MVTGCSSSGQEEEHAAVCSRCTSDHDEHRVTSNTDPTPSSNLSYCDQNIQVNSVTSCPFASHVFVAYWNSGSSSSGWSAADVTAYSPVTSQSYDMDCTTDQSTVNCSGGNNAYVASPMSAVQVY